jgi:hypothetical protein
VLRDAEDGVDEVTDSIGEMLGVVIFEDIFDLFQKMNVVRARGKRLRVMVRDRNSGSASRQYVLQVVCLIGLHIGHMQAQQSKHRRCATCPFVTAFPVVLARPRFRMVTE